MPSGKSVEIQKAKGRPMLSWVGKQPLKRVIAYPAQLVESYGDASLSKEGDLWQDWPKDFPHSGLLFHGDNKDVLAYLLANGFRGQVKLIYIDPPFDSGADYIRQVSLRGRSNSSKLLGESYSLGEQTLYTDIWLNDNYLQFMYERLLLLREILSEDGSLYVHCDWHKGHYLKIMLDEIFGHENMINEIIWYYWNKFQMRGMGGFPRNHEMILWYVKNKVNYKFYPQIQAIDRPKKLKRIFWDKEVGKIQNVKDDNGNVIYDEYIDEKVDDVWDIPYLGTRANERREFNTQKPESILERIINTSSDPNDIILDCFVGSGTTSAVAQKLGRRWIACDINKGSIQTTAKCLQTIIQDQRAQPLVLPASEEEGAPAPCQYSFSVYRVNDYDLQIQHNEALNLACEHLGITRSKTDRYFDGTLGKNLVKIIPFNHPLSPLDLEEIKRELTNRPDETRSISVVSLGKELAVDTWLEEWNRFRKQTDLPNKIEVIELRTDPKAGGFFAHQPDQAKIEVKRVNDSLHIEIKSFISPTIIQRLNQQSGVLTPQIDDWRAMVDSVMIDTDYDGNVFNIVYADIPEKKSDLVNVFYDIDFPKGKKKTTVAVKITDMLGEELLFVQKVNIAKR
jgi:DNA modification methylase